MLRVNLNELKFRKEKTSFMSVLKVRGKISQTCICKKGLSKAVSELEMSPVATRPLILVDNFVFLYVFCWHVMAEALLFY